MTQLVSVWFRSIPVRTGKTLGTAMSSASASGPSPCGRGKRRRFAGRVPIVRSIPVRTGKTGQTALRLFLGAVHPRADGENAMAFSRQENGPGPSPCGRGKLQSYQYRVSASRSIPVRTGKTVCSIPTMTGPTVHPRADGENFKLPPAVLWQVGPSPCGRGKPWALMCAHSVFRSIPVRTGKTVREGVRHRL